MAPSPFQWPTSDKSMEQEHNSEGKSNASEAELWLEKNWEKRETCGQISLPSTAPGNSVREVWTGTRAPRDTANPTAPP